jgi:hypothetical protein
METGSYREIGERPSQLEWNAHRPARLTTVETTVEARARARHTDRSGPARTVLLPQSHNMAGMTRKITVVAADVSKTPDRHSDG